MLVVLVCCYFEIPDEIVELINLLLVVVSQRVLLPLLAFDECRFYLQFLVAKRRVISQPKQAPLRDVMENTHNPNSRKHQDGHNVYPGAP